MIRPPAVAGSFYPADAQELAREVAEHEPPAEKKRIAIACMVPHAGYMFSGHVAGAVYGALELPRKFILLGPRHFPRGGPLAILSEGAWRTPLGDAKIDAELAQELVHRFPLLREDALAHSREHSLEVQLPFLQHAGEFTFVPVVLGTDRLGTLEELGRAVAAVIAAQKEPVLIVASSDMNHYESDSVTRAKDRLALDHILALDARGLFETVRREEISMCGYAPTVAMLTAARELGAQHAELVRYATSGDINGDREKVVGYAGIILH
ncbi:MAG: AmmeMemoRadiSam system protein B [Candidatus Acidiferrales bacterium]